MFQSFVVKLKGLALILKGIKSSQTKQGKSAQNKTILGQKINWGNTAIHQLLLFTSRGWINNDEDRKTDSAMMLSVEIDKRSSHKWDI